MAQLRRLYWVLLVLGYTLVVGCGLVLFYVAPFQWQRSERLLLALAAGVGILSGIFLIARSVENLPQASAGEEPHIPGLDAEVEGPGEISH
ncbi:MAG: hypothetical protein K6T59_16835 [Bryobacteraceae bacterium]|jgi:hypothetical protein|nr:hypothetical protein [Bryobacteraceae bacterium]